MPASTPKKELMDAKPKISMISAKTAIRFGLDAVDEKKNDREGHVELVSIAQPGMEKARSMEAGDQEEMEAFFGGI